MSSAAMAARPSLTSAISPGPHAQLKHQMSSSTSPSAAVTPSDDMALSRSDVQMMQRLRDQSPVQATRKKSFGGTKSPSPLSSSFTAPPTELRVAVLGFNGVGKTAFIVRFLTRRFIGEYCRGIEAKYKCSIPVDGEIVNLSILDSSIPTLIGGSDHDVSAISKSPSSAHLHIRLSEHIVQWADAFILVYSITSHRSFQIIREMRKQISEIYPSLDKICHKPVIMLLGNKADLEHFREVDSKNAEAYVEQKNDLAFYELSTANSPDDVQRCMYAFIRLARVRLLTSMAAASMVRQASPPDLQPPKSQENGNSSSKHLKDAKNLKDAEAAAAAAAAVAAAAAPGTSANPASDGGKQSAKTFLLNKMFGGMMKQARQASGQSSRRSADIVMAPTGHTFSD